jgi:phosphate transport system ATP-binding protein
MRRPGVSDLDVLKPILSVQQLSVSVKRDRRPLLREVSFDIPRRMLTSIIGPSGAGKSTMLKCINRLIDLTDTLEVSGSVLFEGQNTRAAGVDPDQLRRRIGIVFQQPVVFPGSIERNVLFAAERCGIVRKDNREAILEASLTQAGLWKEVRDRLSHSAATLSVGQQQRLAIARTLCSNPDVVLMDEPTSALDPKATRAVEETIAELKKTKTVVLVTHHLQQARRLSDWVVCLCPVDGAGELMEAAQCETVFCCPTREETVEFLAGVREC